MAEFLLDQSISHNMEEEVPEAKARWFQSLTVSERMEVFCAYTDLILSNNSSIADLNRDQPTSRRIRILSKEPG